MARPPPAADARQGLKTFQPSARMGGVDRIAVVKGTRPRFHCSPSPRKIEMADPADPAETTFQRLLNHEILVSERRRMLTLAALQAFILVLILLIATLAPGFVRSIYHDRLPERAALTALSAFIAYELFAAGLVTIFLRRGRNYPVFARYANALVETSFPTVLLFLLAGYLSAPAIVFGTWPALLYFLFIILSTLRLDFALSAFTGAVAAVELFALASEFSLWP
jgi:adenylate cyclase